MLACIEEDGAVLRADASADTPVVAALDRGALVRVEAACTQPDGGWLRGALPDGRTGWFPDSVRVHVFQVFRLNQREAAVHDRPGAFGMPLRTLRKGARFHVLGVAQETGGDWVEIHEPSGERGYLPPKTRLALADADEGAFAWEVTGLRRGVTGGLVMMAIAVVWFVLGYRAGRTFSYPPILFAIGLAAAVRGTLRGGLRGRDGTDDAPGAPPDSSASTGMRMWSVALGGMVLVGILVFLLTRR